MLLLFDLIHSKKYSPQLLRYLCRSNPELIHMESRYGISPLILAAREGCYTAVKILLQEGANVHHTDTSVYEDSAITWSVFIGDEYTTRLLIQYGADVNSQTQNNGYTLLMWAYKQDHFNVFNLLLYYGADINIRSNFNQTIHHMCVRRKPYAYSLYQSIQERQICILQHLLQKDDSELGLARFVMQYLVEDRTLSSARFCTYN